MIFPPKPHPRVERWDAELVAQQGKRQLLLAELSASEDQQAATSACYRGNDMNLIKWFNGILMGFYSDLLGFVMIYWDL